MDKAPGSCSVQAKPGPGSVPSVHSRLCAHRMTDSSNQARSLGILAGSGPLPGRVALAAAALVLWLTPLLRMRRQNRSQQAQTLDRRARWGVRCDRAATALRLLDAVHFGLRRLVDLHEPRFV